MISKTTYIGMSRMTHLIAYLIEIMPFNDDFYDMMDKIMKSTVSYVCSAGCPK